MIHHGSFVVQDSYRDYQRCCRWKHADVYNRSDCRTHVYSRYLFFPAKYRYVGAIPYKYTKQRCNSSNTTDSKCTRTWNLVNQSTGLVFYPRWRPSHCTDPDTNVRRLSILRGVRLRELCRCMVVYCINTCSLYTRF